MLSMLFTQCLTEAAKRVQFFLKTLVLGFRLFDSCRALIHQGLLIVFFINLVGAVLRRQINRETIARYKGLRYYDFSVQVRRKHVIAINPAPLPVRRVNMTAMTSLAAHHMVRLSRNT